MVRVVVVAVLVVALLSGCTSSPQTDSTDDPSSSSSTSGSGASGLNGTASGGTSSSGGNSSSSLVANLTADALNGTAPLLVNFTVGATPASATATWTLATNGTSFANGTGVPAAANHTFLASGSWNVTLTVMDGGRTANATLVINVTGGGARAPVQLASYTNAGLIGGPYALTNDPVMAHQCPGFNAGQDGYGCVFLEFSAVGAHDGLPALVTTDAGNFRFALFDACDPTSGTGVGFASGATGGQFTVATGTGCIVGWSSTIGDWGSEKTFTVEIYDWLPEPDE